MKSMCLAKAAEIMYMLLPENKHLKLSNYIWYCVHVCEIMIMSQLGCQSYKQYQCNEHPLFTPVMLGWVIWQKAAIVSCITNAAC